MLIQIHANSRVHLLGGTELFRKENPSHRLRTESSTRQILVFDGLGFVALWRAKRDVVLLEMLLDFVWLGFFCHICGA